MLVIEHPLGGEAPERVAAKATQAVSQLLARLGR